MKEKSIRLSLIHIFISPKRLGFGMVSDAKADYNFMKDRVMDEVKRLFKPEFLNRIDEIIVFHQLTREHIKGIADIMLGTIGKRCKEQLLSLIHI